MSPALKSIERDWQNKIQWKSVSSGEWRNPITIITIIKGMDIAILDRKAVHKNSPPWFSFSANFLEIMPLNPNVLKELNRATSEIE